MFVLDEPIEESISIGSPDHEQPEGRLELTWTYKRYRFLAAHDEPLRSVLVARGAGYPPPSPADYSPRVDERVRPVRWRSEVLALVHRPIPVSLEAPQEHCAHLLRRATAWRPRPPARRRPR